MTMFDCGANIIFISYRREGGAEMARLIRERLEHRGYRVFLDVDDLRSGPFNAALFHQIESSTDVLVVLTPNSLDQCCNERDWMRLELYHAIKEGKNIVPVMARDFQWPEKPLPKDIAALQYYNGLTPSHEYFEATIDRLTELLRAQPTRRTPRFLVAAGVASVIIAIILIGLTFLQREVYQSNKGQYLNIAEPGLPVEGQKLDVENSRDPCDALLDGGKIMFRTEGFNLFSYTDQFSLQKNKVDGKTINDASSLGNRLVVVTNKETFTDGTGRRRAYLTFQINNQSEETVTISNLQVILAGIINLYEDQIAEPIAPNIEQQIEDLNVIKNSKPIKNYVDLNLAFKDKDTPKDDLEYHIVKNTDPNIVTIFIDTKGMLHLNFEPDQTGQAEITVRAIDPFHLFADQTFIVTISDQKVMTSSFIIIPKCQMNDMEPYRSRRIVEANISINEKRIDLGTILFRYSLRPKDVVSSCASGDLLDTHKTHVIRPNTIESFHAGIVCSTGIRLENSNLQKDAIIGFWDPRRKLSVNAPRLVETLYAFMVTLHVNSQSGKSFDLYSDRIYTLSKELSEEEAVDLSGNGFFEVEPAKASDYSLKEFLHTGINSFIKTYTGTVAFERDQRCGAIADDFSPWKVSPFCYYGYESSPFRTKDSKFLFSEQDRWPRSNYIRVMKILKSKGTPIWNTFETELSKLIEDKNGSLYKKAVFVQDELSRNTHSEFPIEYFVKTVQR